ncbi:MAG: hypothetical protein KAX78_10445 [Phycisphaerae bacterium]|nr:hypothetical protein [Phycisphaerae bacterium]
MQAEVKDGPVDQDRFSKAPLRIVHLLKQATEFNASFTELIERIVRENRLGKKFMYRLALRSYGLLHGFMSFRETEKVSDKELGESLLQVAIVNLEKIALSRSTSQEDTEKFARDNRERWHGQIQKCRPHLIVCGGTFTAVWRALDKPEWHTASTGMDWFCDREVPSCVYLDMCHPTARYPLGMVHTYLMMSAKETLAKYVSEPARGEGKNVQ